MIDSWTEPHTEDRVNGLRIGTTELGYAKLAIRCAVTLVDQESGQRAGPEPLRTLAGCRRSSQRGVAFGTKLAVLRTGKIAVGDALTVTSWGESQLPGPRPLLGRQRRSSAVERDGTVDTWPSGA
ncbi:MOSC domain-containing protein [Streptomyces sp. NPDC001401]|uniref:MOSC domain-containing protein n=1 Tax=Streptomyces sp. NPDC001401 TaxID=3364570 RepID=UPI0036B8A8D7